MYALKPYLDSDRSESDWIGFVVRFGLTYLMQKRFGPAFALILITITNKGTHKQTTKDSGQKSD